MIEANWLAFILALLIGILVAYWVFARGTKGAERRERRPDALDEGAEPARRNQALIDSPPAAAIVPPTGTGTMAGMGEVIAPAAQDEATQAEARQWEEKEKQEQEQEQTARSEPSKPQPAPSPAADTEADDLRKLKGVGPKLVAQLHSLGITRYDQIAAWTDEDIDRIDSQLAGFQGRIRRDNWVEQARFLAAGDTAGYEARFGKL